MKNEKPRAYTPEEVRKMFYAHLRNLAQYWEGQSTSSSEKFEGFIHSVLATFDGSTHLPALDIHLCPHPDDKNYNIIQGKNWFKPNMLINDTHMTAEFYRKEFID